MSTVNREVTGAPLDDLARMRRLLAEVLDAQRRAFGLRNHLATIAHLQPELAWAFPMDDEAREAVRRHMVEVFGDQ